MRSFASCLVLLTAASLNAADAPKSPLSPEESLKHFVLADPNLQIEIVAAEPEVIDPVAIQFDEHGRLWVVEMRDYPNGPEPGKPPMSRIKLLEDKDGDGRYETAHVFADKLLFATGVQPWDAGVIVTLAGEVAYFKDTDGDHKADIRETWFTGFAQANPQLRANHPTFGPDGWIYVANGLRGGNVIAVKKDWPVKVEGRWSMVDGKDKNHADHQPSTINHQPTGISHDPANPQPVSLTGRDFKFDPLTGRYEAISGNGQFGMTFDAWGNRFVCDNRHPCRHVIFEEDFIERCPHVAFPAVVHDVIPADDKNQVFPLTSAWTTSNLHAGTFTAACGLTVYTGDWLPEEFRGNVFVCEPTGNLVQRAVLEPDGVTFKSRNPHAPNDTTNTNTTRRAGGVSPRTEVNPADKPNTVRGLTPPARQEVVGEFLASRDDWFRPVDLQNGPDGALYVVDMYRAVIEHPEWVPDELKKRPDTWLGNDMGRIYRIRPKGEGPKRESQVSVANLDASFNSANGWQRITASRHLHERLANNEPVVVKAVSPHARVLALQSERLAERAPKINVAVVRREEEPWLRAAVIRRLGEIARSKSDPKIGRMLFDQRNEWSRDPEPCVRFSIVQNWPTEDSPNKGYNIDESLLWMATHDAADSWMRLAVVAVTSGQSWNFLDDLMVVVAQHQQFSEPGIAELFSQASRQVGSHSELNDVRQALWRLSGSGAKTTSVRFFTTASALSALLQGASPRGFTSAKLRSTLDKEKQRYVESFDDTAIRFASMNRTDANDAAQRQAIHWLRYVPFEVCGNDLKKVATNITDQAMRSAAVESFASFHYAEVDAWLVDRYRSETPAIRRAILAALFASKERQLRLLEAIEQGQIAATELDPLRVNQLTQAKDETLRERAKTVLAAAAPASRHEVLDAYRPALALTVDPKRGREVFVKNCSTCHRVDNVGVNVAPDISDTRTKKPEQLLLDILDPNKAIDANYFAYAVVTKEGKTESGVIASETATSITLKQPEGKVLTLLRSDIEDLRNTGLSLMPVGVEKNINPQQMADLIFWLKNWRYLDGKVPATSLK